MVGEMENEEMERDSIIATVLSASTLEQCHNAEDLIIAWMKNHPRDFGILDAGEQLAMVSGKYEPRSKEVSLFPVPKNG